MLDPVVTRLEMALRPMFEPREVVLSSDKRFSQARVYSIRHAGVSHTIGLTCHPIVQAKSPEDAYSIFVTIIARRDIGIRGVAVWSQPFVIDRLSGYAIHEAITPVFSASAESVLDTLSTFLAYTPKLLKAFDRGVRRGRPPGRVTRWLNRLRHGCA